MRSNAAVELTGQYMPSEAGPSPNNNSGWGRVDLSASFITAGATAGFADGAGGSTRATRTRSRSPSPTGRPPTLRVALVWTDPPGAQLQNDLDLIVKTADGQERHGNMGTGTDFDRVNNVEQVVWQNVPSGTVSIVISAFRITTGPQPYAYAWTLA